MMFSLKGFARRAALAPVFSVYVSNKDTPKDACYRIMKTQTTHRIFLFRDLRDNHLILNDKKCRNAHMAKDKTLVAYI